MKKKILIVTLLTSVVLGLTACGQEATNTTTPATESTVAQEQTHGGWEKQNDWLANNDGKFYNIVTLECVDARPEEGYGPTWVDNGDGTMHNKWTQEVRPIPEGIPGALVAEATPEPTPERLTVAGYPVYTSNEWKTITGTVDGEPTTLLEYLSVSYRIPESIYTNCHVKLSDVTLDSILANIVGDVTINKDTTLNDVSVLDYILMRDDNKVVQLSFKSTLVAESETACNITILEKGPNANEYVVKLGISDMDNIYCIYENFNAAVKMDVNGTFINFSADDVTVIDTDFNSISKQDVSFETEQNTSIEKELGLDSDWSSKSPSELLSEDKEKNREMLMSIIEGAK